MENIRIRKMRLENFKCHRKLELSFDGRNASIYGDNATGKTSVYDALTWLLFGKDSKGNGEKNIDIKPLNASGEVADHQAVTEVEAVLLVNGDETSLRRTYQEVWSTKRGSTEATYDGNTSEYYVNGVPCKKNAFDSKIKEIVPEDTFRMLTSVNYFASDLPWQKRREILFQIAGVMDDRAVMETDGRFAPLLDAMGRLSLDDLKRKLLAEKKGYVGARNEIPARISECQKTIDDLAALDFAGARENLELANASRENLSGQLLAINRNSAADGKRNELEQAKLELRRLDMDNAAYRREQEGKAPSTEHLRRTLDLTRRQADNARADNEALRKTMERNDRHIAECREKWGQINAETFTGGTCPTCGQALPADQLKTAREKFEAGKQKRLNEVVAQADYWKLDKTNTENRIAVNEDMIARAEAEAAELEEQIQRAEKAAASVTVQDMEGYAEKADSLKAWIAQVEKELDELNRDSSEAGREIRGKIAAVNEQIAQLMTVIGKEDTLKYARGRIEQLRADAAAGAEKLQEVEKLLFLMEEFTRYKTSFVEDTVNSLFRLAAFRLYREQANGGVEDRCDVTYNGVPYMGLNSGMKINVGIDIINTLSRAYGVTVPLFVDNAESVTRLENPDTQVIRLVVSENDKELRVNYEN